MNRIIALDVDGVLADFDAHWRQCAEQVLGRNILQVNEDYQLRTRYGLHPARGLTRQEYDAVWRAYHDGEWSRLPLYVHAADLIYALEDLGCQVWAVTSIDERHRAARAQSLHGLILAKRVLCVGHNASAHDKAAILRHLEAVAFLDDHPANVNAAISVTELPVLLDCGYQGLEAPEYGSTVIDDIMDFPVLVEQLLKRTGRAA
jgi:FMN phosphatase YigB (HAD superfamily)